MRRGRFSKPPLTQRSNLNANSFYLRDSYCDIATRKNLYFRGSNTTPFGFRPKGWCLSRSGNGSAHFRRHFAMGKIRGTLRMRSHISIHRATTKYFSNSFVFKNEIEKEGLPRDSTPALGAGGLRFKSGRPDQNISRVFFSLLKVLFTQILTCGNPPDRRSGFASRLVSKSSPHDEFAKTRGGRRAIQKPLNGSS